MRRMTMLLLALPMLAMVAACSPEAQEKVQSGLQTAAPTIKAAAEAKLQTAAPTLEAAAQQIGTQVVSGLQTAGPTLEAAGTQVAGAIGTAMPTLQAAGTQIAGGATGAMDAAVLANAWAWQSTKFNNDTVKTPATPADYTVKFNADGTVAIKADCNNAAGTYTVEAGKLTITVGPMTLAMCPEGSLSDEFVKELGQVNGYLMQNGKLYLTLKLDTGSMEFASAAP
jgi:heat shock protein HslJ